MRKWTVIEVVRMWLAESILFGPVMWICPKTVNCAPLIMAIKGYAEYQLKVGLDLCSKQE